MKKAIACLMALAIVLSCFAGCGTEAASSAMSEQPSDQATAAAAPAESAAPQQAVSAEESAVESAEESTAEEAPQFVTVDLPIVTEPETFSIWYTWPPVLSNFTSGPGASPFAEELEKRTGIHIDYHIISTESATEEFSLMAAGGNYTDMILGGTSYYDNPDQIIDDGVAVDIAPYLDTLMPNLKAVLGSSEDYTLAAYTDSGKIPECYKFEIGTDQNVGPVIRQDWLSKLNLDVPETYDDYHTVLTAFKNEIGASAPLLMPYTGLTNYFSLGYGIPCDLTGDLFYVVDDEVRYAGLEEDYYDYLKLMAQWYKEGLIDPDFLSRTTSTDPDWGLISGDNAGVWTANVLMFGEYAKSATNPDFAIEGTAYPKESADAPMMYLNQALTTGAGYVVTTDCHDIDTCLKWIDYWYSKDGTFLANYGIEGTSFVYDESGKPHLTELILESDIGLPSSLTSSIYITSGGPYVEDCTRNQYFFGDSQRQAMDIWDHSDESFSSYAYPSGAGLTTDEADTYSAIMSDIGTYMEETVTSVLVGNADAAVLDEMASKLQSMNIDEALSLKQDAYDRYLAKAG